jgi:4-diphosphocytidyl-2-C-methyl-D-erythritol kinase
VTLRAPAKLNLRLRVHGRRDDGFHSIETLFLRLGLADEVSIDRKSAGLRLETSGAVDVPGGEDNLCWQSAAAFFDAIGRAPAASMQLVKHIPVAAGLGGGSSDAAAVLLGLNRVHDYPLDHAGLMRLAERMGSDVPFFVSEARFALAWERGTRLLPLEPPPSRAVLIVVPDFGVSAGEAYMWLRADRADSVAPGPVGPGALPATTELADWDVLAGLAQNDLAEPVYRRHPELRATTEALVAGGAVIALLCGSGACVAGVFQTAAQRDKAAERLRGDPAIGKAWSLISTWSESAGYPEAAG